MQHSFFLQQSIKRALNSIIQPINVSDVILTFARLTLALRLYSKLQSLAKFAYQFCCWRRPSLPESMVFYRSGISNGAKSSEAHLHQGAQRPSIMHYCLRKEMDRPRAQV